MALEAVGFQQRVLVQSKREFQTMAGGSWSVADCGVGAAVDVGGVERSHEPKKRMLLVDDLHLAACSDPSFFSLVRNFNEWDLNSSHEKFTTTVAAGRRKRRRTKKCKNKEEIECLRLTHIAVERNRRKQMNEYLNVLRSIMPASYVHKNDQASIVGGAINFVKELEYLLQSMESQKQIKQQPSSFSPFSPFFTVPQHTTSTSPSESAPSANNSDEAISRNRSVTANIEVTLGESHANLKVLSRRRPKQLLKIMIGLHNLRLTALHLSLSTIDHKVLYCFSLKVEDDCQLTSGDDIATAIHQMLGRIQEEPSFDQMNSSVC